MRSEKVHEKCVFPTRKGRHQRVDFKELLKKAEEDYVDFQEAWHGEGPHVTTETFIILVDECTKPKPIFIGLYCPVLLLLSEGAEVIQLIRWCTHVIIEKIIHEIKSDICCQLHNLSTYQKSTTDYNYDSDYDYNS